jgi:hypothetical protein
MHKSIKRMTVFELRRGVYRFSVHHFGGVSDIASSNLNVRLILPNGENVFFKPAMNQNIQGKGDVWTVFEVDFSTLYNFKAPVVKTINNYQNVDIFEFLNFIF